MSKRLNILKCYFRTRKLRTMFWTLALLEWKRWLTETDIPTPSWIIKHTLNGKKLLAIMSKVTKFFWIWIDKKSFQKDLFARSKTSQKLRCVWMFQKIVTNQMKKIHPKNYYNGCDEFPISSTQFFFHMSVWKWFWIKKWGCSGEQKFFSVGRQYFKVNKKITFKFWISKNFYELWLGDDFISHDHFIMKSIFPKNVLDKIN